MASLMRSRLSSTRAVSVQAQAIRQFTRSSACMTSSKYLQESPVDSMYFQNALPRLPLPELDESLDRYLDSIKPVTSAEDYAAHKEVVENFRANEGPALHAKLAVFDKANKHTSYVTKAWFDKYLNDPSPIAVHSNPYVAFNDDPSGKNMSQLDRATVMVNSAIRFMFTLDASKLKPDAFHMNPKKSDVPSFLETAKWIPDIGPLRFLYAFSKSVFPLDMSQYGRLFNSTRLPREKKDELFTDRSAKHLAVMRNCRIYFMDILDSNGDALPLDTIRNSLAGVLAETTAEPEFPLGAMTTTDRPTWAKVRAELEADPQNKEQLTKLDSALFLYNLDDHCAETDADMSRQFLFGKGKDRYFDKSFSLITRPDGLSAVNFEHAWGDGVAVLRFINEVYADVNNTPQLTGTATATKPTEMELKMSENVKKHITSSQQDFEKLVGGLEFQICRMGPMGKDEIKEYGVGADAVCQFVLQYGYYKMTGKFVPTYESCSTAAFKHGRTETVRSNTPETQACVLTFSDPNATRDEKMKALQTAAKKHGELTKNAATGKGFDRYMYMLKKFSEDELGVTPELFTHAGVWSHMNHIILSTSTLSSDAIKAGGFGPVCADGFGVGYSLIDGYMGLHITNYENKAEKFAQCTEECWAEISEVLTNTVGAKKAAGEAEAA